KHSSVGSLNRFKEISHDPRQLCLQGLLPRSLAGAGRATTDQHLRPPSLHPGPAHLLQSSAPDPPAARQPPPHLSPPPQNGPTIIPLPAHSTRSMIVIATGQARRSHAQVYFSASLPHPPLRSPVGAASHYRRCGS